MDEPLARTLSPDEWMLVPIVASLGVNGDIDLDAVGEAMATAIRDASSISDEFGPAVPMLGELYRQPFDPVVDAEVATYAAHTSQELEQRIVIYALALFMKRQEDMPDWKNLLVRAKRAMDAAADVPSGGVTVMPLDDLDKFGAMTARAEAGHR
jgi:hypothetical protein